MTFDELDDRCLHCDGLQWIDNNEGYTCIAPCGACPYYILDKKKR